MKESLDPSYIGDGIYRENIIDHYKNPHNKGLIKNADIKFTENNPLCGDVITITMKVKGKNIEDLKFEGRGCAISQAAASMMTDELKGKALEEASGFTREKVIGMLGIEIGPVRTKCAVLGMVAMKEGIKEFQKNK